jgi:hypothetical protein
LFEPFTIQGTWFTLFQTELPKIENYGLLNYIKMSHYTTIAMLILPIIGFAIVVIGLLSRNWITFIGSLFMLSSPLVLLYFLSQGISVFGITASLVSLAGIGLWGFLIGSLLLAYGSGKRISGLKILSSLVIVGVVTGIVLSNFTLLSELKIEKTEKVDIKEIVKNPENYINKTVVVVGKSDFLVTSLSDEQGYIIYLDEGTCHEQQRILFTGTYKAKGIIYGTCGCEYRYVLNITKEEWKEIISKYPELQNHTISDEYHLLLPSPDEGWEPSIIPPPEVEISECKKTEVYQENYTYIIWRPSPKSTPFYTYWESIPAFTTQILKEQRCRGNSITKVYLKCIEPLEKIS